MSCTVNGTSFYDCDFTVLCGTASNTEKCTVESTSSGVRHIVVVTPIIHKHHEIRVVGRINASAKTANAHFVGPVASANNIEWEETKSISTLAIEFDKAEISFVNPGTQDIGTKIYEKSRWGGPEYQIDQSNLAFTITLK